MLISWQSVRIVGHRLMRFFWRIISGGWMTIKIDGGAEFQSDLIILRFYRGYKGVTIYCCLFI